jgi:hypothetical protein
LIAIAYWLTNKNLRLAKLALSVGRKIPHREK